MDTATIVACVSILVTILVAILVAYRKTIKTLVKRLSDFLKRIAVAWYSKVFRRDLKWLQQIEMLQKKIEETERMTKTLWEIYVIDALRNRPDLAEHAEPKLPPKVLHGFYGKVEINGQPAPVGTTIEAKGMNVSTGTKVNPIIVTTAGVYGDNYLLVVQGDISEGATIEFYVNDIAVVTVEWPEGHVTKLDLMVLPQNLSDDREE